MFPFTHVQIFFDQKYYIDLEEPTYAQYET